MYKKENKGQLVIVELKDFYLPFSGKLNPNNQWVILSKIIPWEKVEEKYITIFSEDGAPAIPARVAFGSLIIKEKMNLTDRGTVEQIMENPYLQYFLGMSSYDSYKAPFDASMMVHFRKRFSKEALFEINEIIAKAASEKSKNEKQSNDKDIDKNDKSGGVQHQLKLLDNKDSNVENENTDSNKGNLILDASCAPADITYPTDINLLNEGREKTEEIIDTLYEEIKQLKQDYHKPRTYREIGRKKYLSIVRAKKLKKNVIRKAIRQQLSLVKRNLKTIDKMFDLIKSLNPCALYPLSIKQMKNLLAIDIMYHQQYEMYTNKKHNVADRIVSLSQRYVRPILRGKKNASTEFGAKIAISIVDGISYVEKLSWDNFNEGLTLKQSIERYKERFGYYPKAVMVDKIYRNRDNIKYCKENNIRLTGPKLGRPNPATTEIDKKQEYQDSGIRNIVEGKFGEGKRTYGLGRIMSKLKSTSETEIVLQFMVMNLGQKLRVIFCKFLEIIFSSFLKKIGLILCRKNAFFA